jgi:hypothetical protein
VTPEEKRVIHAALMLSNKDTPERVAAVRDAAQALRISRRPVEGPAPIPCMVRATHSATMSCDLPKDHPGSKLGSSELERGYGYGSHSGLASDGSRRWFNVWIDLR